MVARSPAGRARRVRPRHPHFLRPLAPRLRRATRSWVRRPSPGLSDPGTLGVVAHELRTPITTLYAGSKLLQSHPLSGKARDEVVEALVEDAERLRDFVEDLIAVAGQGGEEIGYDGEPSLLQRIVPRVLAGEATATPRLRFRAHLWPDLPPVAGDDGALERLIRTLVVTVAELAASSGSIDVAVSHDRGRLVVRIVAPRLRGSEALLASVFDPLADDADGRTARIRFGLAAARVTAERLGAQLWAHRHRSGVEVGMTLPAHEEDRRVSGIRAAEIPRAESA